MRERFVELESAALAGRVDDTSFADAQLARRGSVGRAARPWTGPGR